MVDWISSWAKGITLAVVIATIIEMILPENNNKKYVKMIIGVYILFAIISPVITIIKGKSYEFDMKDYEKYFGNTYQVASENMIENNDKNIEEIYIDNIKKDITQKIINKGYEVEDISISIKTDEKNYGNLEKINLKLGVEKSNQINTVSVNKIEIGNYTNDTSKSAISSLTASEMKKLKQYLSDTYNISKDNIKIN